MASPLTELSPRSLMGGLIVAITAILLVGTTALIAQIYTSEFRSAEELEGARLQVAATVLAQQIDVKKQLSALEDHPLEDHFKTWDVASRSARSLHTTLANTAGALSTSQPILTARVPEKYSVAVASDPRHIQKNALEIVATSAATPRWLQPLDFRPEMAYPLLRAEPNATTIYEDAYGSWISGYAPLLDVEGNVAGMVIISDTAEGIAARARNKALTALVVILMSIMGVIVTIMTLSRRLGKDLRMLEKAAAKMADGDISTPILSGGVADIARVSHSMELARRQVARRVQSLTLQHADLRNKLTAAQLQLDPRVLERRERIADSVDKLSTTVLLNDDDIRPCSLVDLDYENLVLKVSDPEQLDLSPGMPAAIRIAVEGEPPLVLQTRVNLRLDLETHVEYRLKLAEPLVDLEELSEGVLQLLNTRDSLRIMPSNLSPVLVDIQAPAQGFIVADAAVENLSATGLAVRVPQQSDVVAQWGTRLKLHLTLPGHIVPIEYRVRIANISESITGSRLGLAFDQEDPGFSQKQVHLTDYVAERLSETRCYSGELRLAS